MRDKLKIGDKVIIKDCVEAETNKGDVFEVILYEPWIVCGVEVAKIESPTTGKYYPSFDVDNLEKVVE